ncbi:MAG: Asp23/Gls24 family envelope stress response protein, partial [Clostridiales Family XIII bacterium]|nr:Asp23/Gls24 family envelope stress response protein [Clostridiales Family XIII bacterium]
QIKKDFSGYFIHPLRSIKEVTQDIRVGSRTPIERSIVRPTYSYLGNYAISDKALIDIVTHAAGEVDGVDSVQGIYIKKQDGSAAIELGVIIRYGLHALDIARHLQTMVEAKVEEITSINILSVDIEIQGLLWLNNK